MNDYNKNEIVNDLLVALIIGIFGQRSYTIIAHLSQASLVSLF